VMFDFKEPSVSIDGYSVNSGNQGFYLRTWEIGVSNDNSSWVRIDGQSTSELKSANISRYFACNAASAESYRYVRIRQTDTSHNGTHYLSIGNLEFFGRLRIRKSVQ
jgi:hypothetical protein